MSAPKKLKQFVTKPQSSSETKQLDEWKDYVRPMEGDTVNTSKNIDAILYGKEQ